MKYLFEIYLMIVFMLASAGVYAQSSAKPGANMCLVAANELLR